jgi:hypothetical protein
VESEGTCLGAIRDVKPQGSNKHGAAATNPRLANVVEGGVRGKGLKKSEKPINPKVTKESVPMKPTKPGSPKEAKDLEKKSCKVPDVRQCKVEVCRNATEATDACRDMISRDYLRIGSRRGIPI